MGKKVACEFHGNDYCGWAIPGELLNENSVVVDVGLGEDISFSQSVIRQYGCLVHGFDPTPRAIEYVERLQPDNFKLYKVGVAARKGVAQFFLPNNELHVSGTLKKSAHAGARAINVTLVDLDEMFVLLDAKFIDLLKIDIEGAEYDLIMSDAFLRLAKSIKVLCVEFHHRWPEYGASSTDAAVRRLRELGFSCVWGNNRTNEEFTFVSGS